MPISYATHPYTLRQLQYALAVAHHLNFRKAADACAVAQPTLSAQLQQLEETLGVKLFERNRSRVLLTSAGTALLERVRRIVLDSDDLLDAARQVRDPFVGTLRIGVIPTISPYFLPRAAPAMRRKYPHLHVLWAEDKTETLRQALAQGELDAAVVALQAELGEVESVEIAVDPFVLAVRRDHPLLRKHSVGMGDLRGLDVLLLDDGHCLRTQALAFCQRAKAEELAFRATSLPTLAQMVADGAGVTLLPQIAVETEAKRAGLKVLPFTSPRPYRTLALVWRRGAPLRKALTEIAVTLRNSHTTQNAPR